ncbi:MAG: carbonate dehydratase [Chthoniobacterales bacterium]
MDAENPAPDTPLINLFNANRTWAKRMCEHDENFFKNLAHQQSPEYLWIGCSDSRVPANEIVDLQPGEVFVHRNVANVVVHTDLNCLSVIQFAVDVLKVKHIMVVGHYGCGGVRATVQQQRVGLADNWLRHVHDVSLKHSCCLKKLPGEEEKIDRLCELNVIEQVLNLCLTTVVRDAWTSGQTLSLHGWIYGLKDGLLRDLGMSVSGFQEIDTAYKSATGKLQKQG